MARWLEDLAIRTAALLVPVHQRGDWLAEWRAELWHTRHADQDRPQSTPWSIAIGALLDAVAVRSEIPRRTRSASEQEHHNHTVLPTPRGTMTMTMMGREFRIAGRTLRRSPGFATVAVLTLAIGIGASTAIFTLLDRVVLNPLPYPENARLVQLSNNVPCVGEGTVWQMATAQFVYYGQESRTIETIGAYRAAGANAVTAEGAERVDYVIVTASMMELIGARATAGRLIDADDDRAGSQNVALVSEGFAERVYGSPQAAVDGTIELDDRPYQIVGVLDSRVNVPQRPGTSASWAPEVWVPMRIPPDGPFANNHVIPMIARISPEAEIATVNQELEVLTAALPEAFPNVYGGGFVSECGFLSRATPLRDHVVGDAAKNLWILFGAVGLVLLIACANVANLMIVRLDARRRDLAVRRALGARSVEVTGHLLAESLLVSIAGGLLGLGVATWGLPALVALAPSDLPRLAEISVSSRAALFSALLATSVGVILAIVPTTGRTRLTYDALREGSRGTSSSPARQRLRSSLVVAQVALALALVTAGGLLLESMGSLQKMDPGFDPEGVLVVDLALSGQRYSNDQEVWELYRDFLSEVRRLPGVVSAGMSDEVPVEGSFGCTVQGFGDPTVQDRIEDAGLTTCAGQEQTTEGYFEAMGIPLVQGRYLERGDSDDPTRAAVVVSEAFEQRFWPETGAMGQQVGPSGTIDPLYTVVGVVGDVPTGGVNGSEAIAIYYPIVWIPGGRVRWPGTMKLVVRTELTDPISLVPEIRRVLLGIDASIPLANARTMDAVITQSMSRLAFTSTLLQVAALMSLLLAAIGLYGVVAYAVGRRTREIGMRMAMGAEPASVQRKVIAQSLRLSLLGLVVGVVLATVGGRILSSLLVDVQAADPLDLLLAGGALIVVSVIASWLPAHRAAKTDPAVALRSD